MYPYYPSPKDLWGKWYEEEKKETRSESPRKGKAKKTVEEEYDSEVGGDREQLDLDEFSVVNLPQHHDTQLDYCRWKYLENIVVRVGKENHESYCKSYHKRHICNQEVENTQGDSSEIVE